jgi:hypothetical protein
MPPEGWVPTANSTAQGRRLSWRAKGLLVDLLSFPDGYNITFDKLMAMAKAAGDPDVEGRDAMRRAMQELERKGYLAHRRVAVKDPGPGGQKWRTETAICDQPIFAGEPGGTGFQDLRDSVPPEFRTSKDQEVSNNTRFNKNDQQQEEAGQHASSLAAARKGEEAGTRERDAELQRLYAAADNLDDERLRRHLLAFERKRPRIYRECRQAAIRQIGGQAGGKQLMAGQDGVRAIDMLSFKYALQHYADGLPDWLIKLPRTTRER